MPDDPADGQEPSRQSISPADQATGIALNAASALAFYLATVFLRLGTDESLELTALYGHAGVSPDVFAFHRYALGLLTFGAIFFFRRRALPRRPSRFIMMRSVFNVLAVACFYRGVALGDAGVANVLNMTYPAFVALLAGPILKERLQPGIVALTLLCLIGVGLNFVPSSDGSGTQWTEVFFPASGGAVHWERFGAAPEVWALASAVLAAFGIVALRGAAQSAPADEILLWMFGLGGCALLAAVGARAVAIPGPVLPYVALSAVSGVGGQYLLTTSYRHLGAAAGSIVSSTRIPIAVVAGFVFLAEPFSGLAWLGAAAIFCSNLLLASGANRRHSVGQDA